MQTVSCPGCGAPVEFKSHASVMAVCGFCRTVSVKDAAAVQDLGRMAAVLEDYSPIQLGTSGVYGERAFTVIGRIQLRWSGGIWNEWYLLFDDGADGWLGDSGGRYVITSARALDGAWPRFEAIRPGRATQVGGAEYIAAEKRTARCIGGQGELPFRVGEGWEARVADFRREAAFVTLDYSDGETPALYAGSAQSLEQMRCQLLRDDEAIRASAGRYRGRIDALACPQCGGAIAYLPGVTASLVCQNCRARLDAATPAVHVLAKGEEAGRRDFTLPLGTTGVVNGREVRVLGALVRADEEGGEWTEYLLHGGRAGFSWLIESEGEWWRAEAMDVWPAEAGAVAVRHDRVAFTKLYDYSATTVLALGAFYWRAEAGERVLVSEYQHGPTRLSSELTPEEFTWSRSSRVAFDQVRTWFKLKAAEPRAAPGRAAVKGGTPVGRFILWLLLVNAVPLILHFRGAAPWVLVGLLALALPPSFIKNE